MTEYESTAQQMWREAGMDIVNRLEEQRKHYCTGPCGQSSAVLAQRSKADAVFKDAQAEVTRLREENQGYVDAISVMGDRREELQAEIEQLQRAIKLGQHEAVKANQWCEELAGRLEQREAEITRLRAEETEQIDESIKTEARLEAEVASLRAELSKLQSHDLVMHEGGTSEVDRALRVINKLEAEVDRLLELRDERDVYQRKAMQKFIDITKERDEAQAEVARLQELHEYEQGRKQHLHDEIGELETDRDEAREAARHIVREYEGYSITPETVSDLTHRWPWLEEE